MKCVFCTISFIMHFTVDFSMRHYAGFLQIGSQLYSVDAKGVWWGFLDCRLHACLNLVWHPYIYVPAKYKVTESTA